MNSLKEKYQKEVVPELQKEFSYPNRELIPGLIKVVINVGRGEMNNAQTKDEIVKNLSLISGQKPVLTKAKKAIAAFKIRQNQIVGAMVTLRGEKMYDFLEKLISITIPRVRDFRGLSRRSFDGHGNYTLAFREQSYFNEISYESIKTIHGLEISIQTSAKSNSEGMALLEKLGFPFTKNQEGA